MSASDLLASLRSLGVDLQTDGTRLRWRPPSAVGPELRERILANREALLGLLIAPGAPLAAPGAGIATGPPNAAACPSCRRPLDLKGRCWRCCDRACARCGRPTGSAFIATCCPCGNALNGTIGDPL
jgi:hypothetical protein